MSSAMSEAVTPSAPLAATHQEMANAIRFLSMDAVQKANSGHPGMPMGMADVATVLFTKFLKFAPQTPEWPDRDRFILSAGHGSMLQYALLYLTGYEKMTLDDLKNFRQLHSHTAGHPEVDHAVGIETTTGPLGQGIATSVGFALAERILNARFGKDIVDHYTYVIASDGDMMEGISHEACSLAGHLGLGRLIVLYDDNDISIDGPTSLSFSDDTKKRFESYGWHVQSVDGHDAAAIEKAIEAARKITDKPSMIACKTRIGFGSPNKENKSAAHGSPLGDDEIKLTREKLGWPHAPFEVPAHILESWRAAGGRNNAAYRKWDERFNAVDESTRTHFSTVYSGALPENLDDIIQSIKAANAADKPKIATRQASGKVLEKLVPAIPALIGGSADLTPSNNTKVNDLLVSKDHYDGAYIHYGVREHGMAAIMNGMALHGGFIPYAGTFLSFADYSRPAIRLAALMKQRVVHVMTHDSIGLGEDGPTHQPVEHLAALRAIPNLYVFRPCDLGETAECWELALKFQNAPSVLALTRQGLPALRTDSDKANLCKRGAYILREAPTEHKATIFATGSEVHLAVEAQERLAKDGIGVRVVSVPCLDLLLEQDQNYIDELAGEVETLMAVEAGVKFGWDAVIGYRGLFVGMESFGASAPAEKLFEYFGITTDRIVEKIKNAIH